MSSTTAVAPLLLPPDAVNKLPTTRDVKILDATWFMPNSTRNARKEFATRRIPRAQYLDLDEVATPSELGLMHMMPSERIFANACERFGITPSTHVILYDGHGVFSSPRALFMFRTFGHTNSSVIDGGIPRWLAEGFPIEQGEPQPTHEQTTYPVPELKTSLIQSYDQIVKNSQMSPSDTAQSLILDARARARFDGTAPEPRPGLPSGHIPGSFSLPFTTFLREHRSPNGDTYTTMLPTPDLHRALLNAVGPAVAESIINGDKRIITSCGSGMTAGVLWLGLELLGAKAVALYDESWTGYALRSSSKIETST
ncbi:hypothetical protein PC9H_003879 [Pleurotus ostreatus]|uniref:Rhodanese domain-containing protein n=1 Tax=Pleurotus ostreatus TaxID=5322 RepID=A0A8H7DVS8_PLEOS|nr:uncharacterized protein PC9H_003879 [Pleurotus ostreatus]KAF7437045.1 hypothetical protein PC9H_003879 [Pleurotus ostreatus]